MTLENILDDKKLFNQLSEHARNILLTTDLYSVHTMFFEDLEQFEDWAADIEYDDGLED